jgi:hypothetical protein
MFSFQLPFDTLKKRQRSSPTARRASDVTTQRTYENPCFIDTAHAILVSTRSCLHLIFSSSLLPLLRYRVEVAFCSSGYFVLTLPFLLCERKCRHF